MKKIKISNFRKVKDSWELDLAPITFFTGKNNSGKSSVLKALMVLSDFGNSKNHFELNFNGYNKDEHKIKDYSNAINWNNSNKSNLEFVFTRRGYVFTLIYKPKMDHNKSKSHEDHFSRGQLVLLRILRRDDNAFLEIVENDLGYQLNIDDTFLNRKLDASHSFDPEIKQLRKVLEAIDIELEAVEGEIKEKLSNNPSLLKTLGVTSAAGIATATLGTILAGPLFFAGAGAGAVLSSTKGREIIGLKKKAEKLQADKRNVQKKLFSLDKKNNYRNEDINVLRPQFKLEEISEFGLQIEKVLRTQVMQYLELNEKELGKADRKKDTSILNDFTEKILNALQFDIHHLSPNRNRQIRLYHNSDKASDINEILEKYSEAPLLEDSEENKFLLKWLRLFEIGSDYKISNISGQANTVEIFDEEEHGKENSKSHGRWVDLVDKGFGAGQLFTILLQIAMASVPKEGKESPLLLIEEPETNLHPKLQSELAELFLDAYSNLGVRFIIETHSEYIIRKTQLVGLEKNFFSKNNQVKNPFKLYYFDVDGPFEMCYTEQGRFERDFGKGFYDVAAKLNMETLKKSKINQ